MFKSLTPDLSEYAMATPDKCPESATGTRQINCNGPHNWCYTSINRALFIQRHKPDDMDRISFGRLSVCRELGLHMECMIQGTMRNRIQEFSLFANANSNP